MNQASKSYLQVGEDLDSCTSEIQESEEFVLDGRRVILIDTPGFDDTHKSDTDVLKSIAAFLGESWVKTPTSLFLGTTERDTQIFGWREARRGHLRPPNLGRPVWRFSCQELPNV